MPPEPRILEVYKAGKLTVVGFGGEAVLDRVSVSDYRDEIESLINEHRCEVLAFDLTGVKLIPSGMLGLLASLHKQLEVEVHLYNPNRDIREVLEIMKLDRVLHVHDLNL
jgi:anti-anti-sigma factor